MTATIESVSEASSWLVVPNSGQIRMPPSPPAPAENVSPIATASTIAVPTYLLTWVPSTSPISWTTKRCRRTPVSIVVAAKRTAMVARIVAESEVGMPRPALRMLPPPCTKAVTPPALNSV